MLEPCCLGDALKHLIIVQLIFFRPAIQCLLILASKICQPMFKVRFLCIRYLQCGILTEQQINSIIANIPRCKCEIAFFSWNSFYVLSSQCRHNTRILFSSRSANGPGPAHSGQVLLGTTSGSQIIHSPVSQRCFIH